MSDSRIEKDSMGELQVPADALYAAQTQRAVENFPISGRPLPKTFITALARVKHSCASANLALGLIEKDIAVAIQDAAQQIIDGDYLDQFPIDVYQTGSGTSSNMNANEVIAHLASNSAKQKIHPNDHVNMSQSSKDVIPTTIHVSASIEIARQLIPALEHFIETLEKREKELATTVKTGRTHLMDAMPITLGQEIATWKDQIQQGLDRIVHSQKKLYELPQGGTAVGTGINAHEDFGQQVAEALQQQTGLPFTPMNNPFIGLACQDTVVEMSGQLKTLAVSLMKIANDLRWMNSGPLAGLSEIELTALQPGSSIMPGKINPVIPEAVAMVAAKVIGNDSTITIAGQSGSFQLNVMLPLIADTFLESIHLLSNGVTVLADKAIAGFKVNEDKLKLAMDRNPILVTALNRVIGYEQGAAIAKRAYAEKRTVIDVAMEMTNLSADDLKKLLDPTELTKGGIK